MIIKKLNDKFLKSKYKYWLLYIEYFFLFNLEDSYILLDICLDAHAGILEIEEFSLPDGLRHLDLDFITDFSSLLQRTGFTENLLMLLSVF